MKPSLQEQVIFYNKHWEDLKPFTSRKVVRISKIMEHLIQIRKQIANPKILDLGCGDGRSVAVWNLFGEASGLDLSESAMETAGKMFPGINFKSGDALHSPYPDNSFDVIISHEVIEHLEDQNAYINECDRLLKPWGFLILTTPNKYYFDHFIKGNYSRQPIENIMNISTLKKITIGKFKILNASSLVIGNAEKGIYKFISNKYLIALSAKLQLEFLRRRFIEKYFLGVHLCILARKK